MKLHYHYNAVRAALPLRFHLLPEDHPYTYWTVHKGLKGYPMKTLILSVAESTTLTISSSHVKILILIKKMAVQRLLKCHLKQN